MSNRSSRLGTTTIAILGLVMGAGLAELWLAESAPRATRAPATSRENFVSLDGFPGSSFESSGDVAVISRDDQSPAAAETDVPGANTVITRASEFANLRVGPLENWIAARAEYRPKNLVSKFSLPSVVSSSRTIERERQRLRMIETLGAPPWSSVRFQVFGAVTSDSGLTVSGADHEALASPRDSAHWYLSQHSVSRDENGELFERVAKILLEYERVRRQKLKKVVEAVLEFGDTPEARSSGRAVICYWIEDGQLVALSAEEAPDLARQINAISDVRNEFRRRALEVLAE